MTQCQQYSALKKADVGTPQVTMSVTVVCFAGINIKCEADQWLVILGNLSTVSVNSGDKLCEIRTYSAPENTSLFTMKKTERMGGVENDEHLECDTLISY